jgi:homoserine O-acetyltransferase
MSTHIFTYRNDFRLESGTVLEGYHLAYTTYGTLNDRGDNVVWVFHALTANSDPAEWWDGLVGENKLFDPSRYFIVCVNMPGSHYGSIGPLDRNPVTGAGYFHGFPWFTTRDMVRSYEPLRKHLGIQKIKIGIGGSMGGQQLLEWAIEQPHLFEYLIPIATNAFHSPWGIAFNASQRMAIEADQTWSEHHENAGMDGLKVARSIALLSYRHYDAYTKSQFDEKDDRLEQYRSESYQRYQGQKLANRFNAFSYFFLSKGMDAHNVGRGRISVKNALEQITAKTLVIGIRSDVLFPITEQQFLADSIPGARFCSLESFYGHDGFLLEYNQIQEHITDFLQNVSIELSKS